MNRRVAIGCVTSGEFPVNSDLKHGHAFSPLQFSTVDKQRER